MIVYVVEGGEYEDRHIIGVYGTKEKAIKIKQACDKVNTKLGIIIPMSKGGDGVMRYKIDEVCIIEWEIE